MPVWLIKLVISIALPYILQRLAEEQAKTNKPDEKQKLEDAIKTLNETMVRKQTTK